MKYYLIYILLSIPFALYLKYCYRTKNDFVESFCSKCKEKEGVYSLFGKVVLWLFTLIAYPFVPCAIFIKLLIDSWEEGFLSGILSTILLFVIFVLPFLISCSK